MDDVILDYVDNIKDLISFSLLTVDNYRILNYPATYKIIAEKFKLPTFDNLKDALYYESLSSKEKLNEAILMKDISSVKRVFDGTAPDTSYLGMFGTVEIVDYILTKLPSINPSIVLRDAVEAGNIDVVKYLYNRYSPDINQLNVLASKAAIWNHLEIVKYLVNEGANDFEFILNSAVNWKKVNNDETVEYLKSIM